VVRPLITVIFVEANNVVFREGPFGCYFGIVCYNVVRSCTWVGQDRRRCRLKTKRGVTVGEICVEQCRNDCRTVVVPTKSPVQSSPTLLPVQSSPTLSPMQTSPTTQVPTFKPTAAPVGPIPNLPPGPFVTVSTSSELVTIPRPETPNLSSIPSNCPHLDQNLKRWHDKATWPSGQIPSSGDNIQIPRNSRIVIDQTVVLSKYRQHQR
jgi:hypothetical protein